MKKKAIVFELLDEILEDHEVFNKIALKELLSSAGVEIHTGLRPIEITEKEVICGDKNWQRHIIKTDSVVSCTGLKANEAAVESLKGLAPETHVIGDAADHYKIYHAFEDAHRAVLSI